MKPILYIKGSSEKDVRLSKFIKYFQSNKIEIFLWAWNREKNKSVNNNYHYLLRGGGNGRKAKLLIYYILWVILVFIKCLRSNLKDKSIIAIDFDSALPVFLASKFKKIDYLYEIYDDFALRYKFPLLVKRMVHNLDVKIMNKSKCVIHVDENRVTYKGCKSIIIENTPNDFYNGNERNYAEIKNKFAVIGYFSRQRGVVPIYKFASEHPEIEFLIVGQFIEKEDLKAFKRLKNVDYYDFMPQKDLYSLMNDCCAIFSLYDPAIEINRLAASNKVYDAMMHGIPVITNKEVVNSKFIKENNIGFVIDYNYNATWKCLSNDDFMNNVKEMGVCGRNLYLKKYLFDVLVHDRLMPILETK